MSSVAFFYANSYFIPIFMRILIFTPMHFDIFKIVYILSVRISKSRHGFRQEWRRFQHCNRSILPYPLCVFGFLFGLSWHDKNNSCLRDQLDVSIHHVWWKDLWTSRKLRIPNCYQLSTMAILSHNLLNFPCEVHKKHIIFVSLARFLWYLA